MEMFCRVRRATDDARRIASWMTNATDTLNARCLCYLNLKFLFMIIMTVGTVHCVWFIAS
jgi:hypothetical protein